MTATSSADGVVIFIGLLVVVVAFGYWVLRSSQQLSESGSTDQNKKGRDVLGLGSQTSASTLDSESQTAASEPRTKGFVLGAAYTTRTGLST